MQTADSPALHDPPMQATGAASGSLHELPAGHDTHAEAPVPVLYVPEGQFAHTAACAALHDPGAQGLGAADGLLHELPAGHGAHADELEAPVSMLYVPEGQAVTS